MSKRHEKIGIKHIIQRDWMDKTLQMLLAGLSEAEIRSELDYYLSTQKPSGGLGERGKKTYGMAIAPLASWFAPGKELLSFRDNALDLARKSQPSDWLPLHWAVISAAYPFWFNVARQTGRLFNLQDQITQAQVFSRLKEQYGDRETISRNARYAVRSFIAWNVLEDTVSKGCYAKPVRLNIDDLQIAVLLVESALLAISEAKSPLGLLMSNPAFFPFQLPNMTGDLISKNNNRVNVVRYGLDDELLTLS